MATARKQSRLSQSEILRRVLDSDDDVSSSDSDSNNPLSGSEGYLANADDLDTEDEGSNTEDGNISGSDMNVSDRSSDDEDGGAHGLPNARGRRPNAADISRPWNNNGTARNRFVFTGNPGIKARIDDASDPLEFFKLFFTDELIDIIVTETNRYAGQFLAENQGALKERSRAKEWKETDAKEIKVFLALLLMQGIVYKPDIEQYFSKRPSLYTPFFRDVMDKDRFILLSKFLHFANNEGYDPDGPIPRKLYKLWPILEHMNKRFSEVYKPERDVAVDESLLLWKGRLSWKQYIPSKRARFGMKSFDICESSSGYIWNFFVYLGKDTQYNPNIPEEKPMGSKVVLTLASPLFGKGYCINMDNFFSSPELFDELCEENTDAVGTLRANRKGVPNEIRSKRLQRGEIKAMYRDKLMVLKWKDKKDIYMISTIHDASTTNVGTQETPKVKPQVCCDYNDTMGGVDLSDAFLSNYPSARKRLKKYYQKQFRHILDMAVLNAHILYKKHDGANHRLAFILQLVERIIEKYKTERVENRKGRPSLYDTPVRLTARHFMRRIPPTPKKEYPQKKCHVCAANGIRKDTSYMCSDCDKALCITPCFETYHSVLNYKRLNF